ncbi:hypothetical protein SCUP515_12833 [Seiridium cupressi]
MEMDDNKSFQELYTDEAAFKSHLWALQGCINDRNNYHDWARRLRFIAVGPRPSSSGPAELMALPETEGEAIQLVEDHATQSSRESTEYCLCDEWLPFYEYISMNEQAHATKDHAESETPASSQRVKRTLHVTPPGCCRDCTHYVAVSWCWGKSADELGDDAYYMVGDIDRPSKTPSIIMERAIAFAASKGLTFIWIDKECIDQEDRDDKEAGIQSMDLVYQRSSWPVGLLNCSFDKQSELDMWDFMIQGQDIPTSRMQELKKTLGKVVRDKWFTRAWILQEAVSGGTGMTLLARHTPGLTKSEYLGPIDGEIELTIEELHYCLVWAEDCVERAEGSLDASLAEDIRHLTADIWSFEPTHITSNMPGQHLTAEEIDEIHRDPEFRQTCNAAQGLKFLRKRQNSRVPDRLAILANLCNYTTRMNTNKVVALNESLEPGSRCGFSICAFALAVLNGDLSVTLQFADEGSNRANHVAFSWGPKWDDKLQSIPYYEDDDIVVRSRPPVFAPAGGLRIAGWLWEIKEADVLSLPTVRALPREPGGDVVPAILWSLLKDLMRQRLVDLADILWCCCSKYYFGDIEEALRTPNPAETPKTIRDVLEESTGELIYRSEGRVEEEGDYAAFFHKNGYKLLQWMWSEVYHTNVMQPARLVQLTNQHNIHDDTVISNDDSKLKYLPSAVFDLAEPEMSWGALVDSPATSTEWA